MNQSRNNHPTHSAVGPTAVAVVFFFITWKLYELDQGGNEFAGWGAIAAALIGVRQLWAASGAYSMNRRLRATERASRTVRKTQGSSRWGTLKDLRRAGMLKVGGFFLGALNGRDVYFNKGESIFCIAPPGTGKTVAGVIPQLLLRLCDEQSRDISKIVHDTKGEIYAITHKRMRALGYKIIVVCAWAEKLSRELGIDIVDSKYNPVFPLLKAGVETKDLAEKYAKLLIPGSANQSASADHFLGFARELITWCLMILAEKNDPSLMNLVEVRKILMSSSAEFDDLLAQTTQSEAFGGTLKEQSNKLLETKINAPEEWSGAINTATGHIHIYDCFGPLGDHVSAIDGFEPAAMKDQPTCTYFMMPSDYIDSHKSYMNFALSTTIERVVQDRTNRRVLVLFDEFCNAGFLPNVLRSLALHRSQGLVYAFYAQSLSQAKNLYGENGLRDMLGMCGVIQAFGVRDPDTLKMLSELAGQDTYKSLSHNLRTNTNDPKGHAEIGTNASDQGMALIRPEDIRTLPDGKQLVFIGNKPPFLLDTVSYLNRPAWRRWASPNPYYRR